VPAEAFASAGCLHTDVCRLLGDVARTLSKRDQVVVFIPGASRKKIATDADAAVRETLLEAGIPGDRITIARNQDAYGTHWFAPADSQPGRVVIEINERRAA